MSLIIKKIKFSLVKEMLICYYFIVIFYGEIAQLARAIGSYPIGQEFESLSRYQIDTKLEFFETI